MKENITQLISDFNKASLSGDIEVVKNCLHPDVVFVGSDFKTLLRGIDDCIQSIIEYNEIAKTISFDLQELIFTQDHRDKIIIMKYFVEYELESKIYKEKTTETIVLTNEDNSWKILWRAIVKSENIE